jgi:hypothetical protein
MACAISLFVSICSILLKSGRVGEKVFNERYPLDQCF